MTDYHSPRYGQAYMGHKTFAGLQYTYVYPLAPDPDAYSVGIPAGDYPTKLNFIYRTSNFTTSNPTSKCALVKDENDIFYYIYTTKAAGFPTRIRVDVYDAVGNTLNTYDQTVPTEFNNTYSTTAIPYQCWFISRRNETEIDFIVVGDDVNYTLTGARAVIQQYRWTIGTTTLTYITEYGYLIDNTAEAIGDQNLGIALVGDQVVIMNRKDISGNTYWYVVVFTLDSGGTYSDFISSVDKQAVSAVFFPAGNLVHIFAIYGIGPTDSIICPNPVPHEVSIEAEVHVTGTTYGATTYDYTSTVHTYTGIGAAVLTCLIWPEYGCNPDTGEVYFRLEYTGQGSEDISCDHGAETVYGTRAYWSLPSNSAYTYWDTSVAFGGSLSWPANGGEYNEPGWWPITTNSGLPNDTWFRFGFPSRNSNPTSILYTNGAPDYAFTLDWITLDEYLVNQLTEVGFGGSRVTRGAGQRNDNLPVLYDYVSTWDSQTGSIFIDKDNTEYARLQTFLGTTNNPVTGSIGLYLVYENLQGRWMILGVLPEPVGLLPRWQVV